MFVLRNGPKGARFASFGFGLCVFAVIPTETGYSDIGALLARQPGVTEHWQQVVFPSAVRSIQVATFGFSRPIGTAIPQSATVRLASLGPDPGRRDPVPPRSSLSAPVRPLQSADFPKVDRTLKGDRLVLQMPADVDSNAQMPAMPAPDVSQPVANAKSADAKPVAAPLDAELAEALKASPLDVSASDEESDDTQVSAVGTDPFTIQTASLYFGVSALGTSGETMESWLPGQEPLIVVPHADADIKATAALPSAPAETAKPGESVANKGEVNIATAAHPKSPAERLHLSEKARAVAEKCLAEAIYFESRGEKVRGQIAVAQVVMNRVFSNFYPSTVCGVVYQNKHRRFACQFTFACDNVADVVREPDMWERARKIARATMDGLLWLPEVGKSTHYHAYWVRPSWVREMKKMYRTGVHTFYRPRAWGDGSDEPSWGSQQATKEISAQLAAVKE